MSRFFIDKAAPVNMNPKSTLRILYGRRIYLIESYFYSNKKVINNVKSKLFNLVIFYILPILSDTDMDV